MDEEDSLPHRRPDHAAAPRDLAPLSVAELESYICGLEAEIARAKAAILGKRQQRSGAEALFKR